MRTTPSKGLTPLQLVEREERVFPTYPQVARYFPANTIEDARHRLGRAIERGDGPGLVIGGPGTGKSLLLQVLASQYHEKFDVVLPACARLCTRRALLQAILFELGLPYKVRDEGDLRLSLLDHLLSREQCPTGLLLLVDEAQTLPISLLDELRVLTNLVRGGAPRVRLVLAGSSALEECFANPELESFSQRLSARCYLSPFGRDETVQFVRAQIAASSASPDDLFTPDSWDAIFEATDGVPRLINQLCDRALIQASAENRNRIDRSVLQSAWAEIQQLPAPWETPPPTTEAPAPLQVVEFGRLASADADPTPSLDELLVSRETEDVELLDAESTELDLEDVVATPNPVGAKQVQEEPVVATAPPVVDPFAEEFDEEEVVLDSFASWDNMFRSEAPRVENRRDPEFATLVQAAISSADVSQSIACASTGSALRMLDTGCEDEEAHHAPAASKKAPTGRETVDWPPLRLVTESMAGVAEVASPASPTVPAASAWNVCKIEPAGSSTWSRVEPAHSSAMVEDLAQYEAEPVLIVEDDTPAPKSPVRREEYRNLFSRLRSG